MSEYIVVTLLGNKKSLMDIIIKELLDKRLVAGIQIHNIDSVYCWNNEIVNDKEIHIEMRTKISQYENIKKIVRKYHNYDVFELSYHYINGNEEFLLWIDNNVGDSNESI